MTEIEQLRADIAAMDAAQKVCFERSWGTIPELQQRIKDKQVELAKLEAEEAEKDDKEKWASRAKDIICNWQAHSIDLDKGTVVRYVGQLRDRIAELESELAKRPKVYCVRTHNGIATTGGFSKVPRVFLAESIEDEYGDGAQCVVPYTGQQA